jgi:energy-coupling factor transport system ATP-binding protein
MQRPESQILGVRVADDVVWGLPADQSVDIAALLESVGLGGMEERDTSTLSGGELQRLAVASALARQPQMLISDESTAMVDPEGRQHLTALLAALPAHRGTAVVHVTHRLEETAASDRTIHLAGGRVVTPPEVLANGRGRLNGHIAAPAVGRRIIGGGPLPGRPLLRVEHISHTYAAASPWAQAALFDVNLTIETGAGVLIMGGNGSGKSTLAWILAGLIVPSEGRCLLDGRPVSEQVGVVALAFQHARLQLQRPTVRADIHAASGASPADADGALMAVGLDPAELADRHIDELSGGEQRRVALAGLLARKPRVLIVDEPLAGLDEGSRDAVINLLAGLRRERGLTVIAVSHDMEEMDGVCDRLVRLDSGRIVSDEPWGAAACP